MGSTRMGSHHRKGLFPLFVAILFDRIVDPDYVPDIRKSAGITIVLKSVSETDQLNRKGA